MFRKYECGCIGFQLDLSIPRAYCIIACDGDDAGYPFICRRDTLCEKRSVEMADTEVEKLLLDMRELIADGYRLRELHSAMLSAGLVQRATATEREP